MYIIIFIKRILFSLLTEILTAVMRLIIKIKNNKKYNYFTKKIIIFNIFVI